MYMDVCHSYVRMSVLSFDLYRGDLTLITCIEGGA